MTELPDLPNPFKTGRVVGENTDPREYLKEVGARGYPEFVQSRSSLMQLLASPYKWRKGVAHKSTDATDWGLLVDAKLSGDDRLIERFATQPAEYTNEDGETKPWNNNAKVCRSWKFQQVDKTIITIDDDENSAVAVTNLLKDSRTGPLIKDAAYSVLVTSEYTDRETGIIVPVKGLIDVVPLKHGAYGDCLADTKTARDGSPSRWSRVIFDYDYDCQGAFYLDLFNAATKEDRSRFVHLISENTAPYAVERSELSAEFLAEGRAVYMSALKLYCRCLAENSWPSASDLKGRDFNGWPTAQIEPWMIGRRSAA